MFLAAERQEVRPDRTVAQSTALSLAQTVKEGLLNQTQGTISGYDIASGRYSFKIDGGSAAERHVSPPPENVRVLTAPFDTRAERHRGKLPTRARLRAKADQRQLNEWIKSAGAAWAKS